VLKLIKQMKVTLQINISEFVLGSCQKVYHILVRIWNAFNCKSEFWLLYYSQNTNLY